MIDSTQANNVSEILVKAIATAVEHHTHSSQFIPGIPDGISITMVSAGITAIGAYLMHKLEKNSMISSIIEELKNEFKGSDKPSAPSK